MARSYVFLVHGVGRHEVGDGGFATWAVPWRDGLIAELQKYAPYDQKTPEQIAAEDICFWPISYDAVFRENFQQVWGDLAGALVDTDVVAANPALKSALEFVGDSESSEDLSAFFWDNALDAILWFTVGLAHASVALSLTTRGPSLPGISGSCFTPKSRWWSTRVQPKARR